MPLRCTAKRGQSGPRLLARRWLIRPGAPPCSPFAAPALVGAGAACAHRRPLPCCLGAPSPANTGRPAESEPSIRPAAAVVPNRHAIAIPRNARPFTRDPGRLPRAGSHRQPAVDDTFKPAPGKLDARGAEFAVVNGSLPEQNRFPRSNARRVLPLADSATCAASDCVSRHSRGVARRQQRLCPVNPEK